MLTPAHAPLLFDALEDDRLWRYESPALRSATVADLERRFARFARGHSDDGRELWLNYALRAADGYVGTVQATIDGEHAMIGYMVFADRWRQGYGKESCAALLQLLATEYGVRVVTATVDVDNVASIALLESLGFVRRSTGPSTDMPGHTDHTYERQIPAVPGAPEAR